STQCQLSQGWRHPAPRAGNYRCFQILSKKLTGVCCRNFSWMGLAAFVVKSLQKPRRLSWICTTFTTN
ncbi:hypothetical protein BX616_010986, partial [Lobosporangium transversale]